MAWYNTKTMKNYYFYIFLFLAVAIGVLIIFSIRASKPPAAINQSQSLPLSDNSQEASPPAHWGAYVGDEPNALTKFESVVGKQTDIVAVFIGLDVGSPFPSDMKAEVADKNKTLLIFWEPYKTSLENINQGKVDTYLSQFTQDAKSYGGPIILAPLHEMNGNWDPWDGPVKGNSPQKIITAWQHIHTILSKAPNIQFGWAINNISFPDTPENSLEAYYPGSSYVDIVGVDGFNFGSPWQTWDEVFPSSLMQKLSSYGKPVYIFSEASAAGSGKATWIADMAAGISKYHIAGWIWFNENKEQNWLINSDTAALKAFQSILP